MTKEIDIKEARCTGLSMSVPVQFAAEAEKKGEFVMEAYTGQVVDRWWGKLAIDVDGIKSKNKMPIFRGHNQDLVVGFSNRAWKENGTFMVAGKFSGVTEAAKEAAALADEGFPWQASIGVSPLKILSVDEKSSHMVNGKELRGPAEVWLQSEVFETSFVPLGADDATSVSVFTKFEEAPNKQEKEKEKMPITIQELETDAPELLAQIRADAVKEAFAAGRKAERERIKAVRECLMPGHEALIEQLANDGETTGEQAAVAVLKAEQQIRKTAAENFRADTPPVIPHTLPKEKEELADPGDKDLPVDERAKKKWDADGALRGEFGGDFEAFSAYFRANEKGQVRILKSKEK